jgi:hypothetical protein
MSNKEDDGAHVVKRVHLNGTVLKPDGETYKSKYFSFLDLHPDDYSDVSYTEEEARQIISHMSHLSTGATAAIPVVCSGRNKCPWADTCPFVAVNKVPVGRACQVEKNLLSEWIRRYAVEYQIEEDNFTDWSLIAELAEVELLLMRINRSLAKKSNAELIKEVNVGIDREGNVITKEEINAAFLAKEKLNARKTRLIKHMVGDREGRYKREAALKQKQEVDASSSQAKLRIEVEKLQREAAKKTLQLKEARTVEVVTANDLVDSIVSGADSETNNRADDDEE